MKYFMILCFGMGALWDGITTVLGIASIIHADTPLGYATCGIGGILILGFTIGTRVLFSESEPIYYILRIFWLVAILFDGFTALTGNANYIILKRHDRNYGHV